MFDDEALSQHLRSLGWKPEPHGERTYRIQTSTDEGDIAIYVRLTQHWMIATIVPFLETKGDNSFELCRWLLRQNRDMAQTKFATDDDGDIVLTVELPTEAIDRGEIRVALENLVTHFVTHRRTLRYAAVSNLPPPADP